MFPGASGETVSDRRGWLSVINAKMVLRGWSDSGEL